MKLTLLIGCLLMTLGLSGCGNLTQPSFLENRLMCTLSKDKAAVVSQWGPIGIASEIRKADTAVICK